MLTIQTEILITSISSSPNPNKIAYTYAFTSPYCTTFAMAMQPGTSPGASDLYRLLAESMIGYVDPYGEYPSNYTVTLPSASCSSRASYFPMAGVTTELPHGSGRDLAASRNQHKEAEKQRRKRINSHLDKLRSLLPCNSKTDKASLLAKVVQHVKELKQQTSEIPELNLFPSESDEIAVFSCDPTPGGRTIFKASLCCEDRSDLLPELIETLKSLRMRTLRAEMATMGGRVRSVLFLVAGDEDEDDVDECRGTNGKPAGFLRDALKAIVEKQGSGTDRGKRRRFVSRENGGRMS